MIRMFAIGLLGLLSLHGQASAAETWLGVGMGAAALAPDDSEIDTDESPVFGMYGLATFDSGFGYELGLKQFTDFDSKYIGTSSEFSLSSLEASAIYHLWLGENLGLSARLGAAYWRARGEATFGGVSIKFVESDTAATAGLGLLFKPEQQHLLRIEAQGYREMLNDSATYLLKLDYAHHF